MLKNLPDSVDYSLSSVICLVKSVAGYINKCNSYLIWRQVPQLTDDFQPNA